MNRKKFLSSLIVAGASAPALAFAPPHEEEAIPAPILPRYLKLGDTIGITCPARGY
jgi:muramoyltetrapeptide carboxypeptidase